MSDRDESGPVPEIDPELIEDLGDEFEFRGDRLEAEIEEARADAARHLETAQRVQAEFENFRKRMLREQTETTKRASERVTLALLPIIDNLERAIDHAAADGGELLSGVEMVVGQLRDVLEKEGVRQVDPFGKPFDAVAHQAVGQTHDVEVADGTVVEVYQKGYEMHGKVIRPAMVVVSTGGPAREE